MDYKMKTTFMNDFDIASVFGESAVRDTYKRAFNEWHTDKEYLTELSMVLNWQSWKLAEKGKIPLAKVYDELWRKTDRWCLDNLKGGDLDYYIKTTD